MTTEDEMFPLQIQFSDIEKSDFVYNAIWDHAEKLQKFYDRIISGHVMLSVPNQLQRHARIYHIQVRLNLPGGDIFVRTDPEKDSGHEDIYAAIRDAFDATRRQLEDFIRRQRGFVKERHTEAHAKIMKLFLNDGFGFICTQDDREIYFHENSVLNHEFGQLKIGDEVRFSEEPGEKGPQVSSMIRVGHSGHLGLNL